MNDERSLSATELLALKNRLLTVITETGRWVRRQRSGAARGEGDLEVRTKTGPGDLVTFADGEAQRRLVAALATMLPGSGFVGEEDGLARGDGSRPTWVIDPIDGTQNFVRGYPGFCVSVGLVEGNEPVLGAIYDAEADDVIWAVAGEGCWRGSDRLTLTAGPERLDEVLQATNLTKALQSDPKRQQYFLEMAAGASGVRASGSACRDLRLAAEGRVDVFWQFDLGPWDVAAGLALVREAGGSYAFLEGGGRDWARALKVSVVAGASGAVAEALRVAERVQVAS